MERYWTKKRRIQAQNVDWSIPGRIFSAATAEIEDFDEKIWRNGNRQSSFFWLQWRGAVFILSLTKHSLCAFLHFDTAILPWAFCGLIFLQTFRLNTPKIVFNIFLARIIFSESYFFAELLPELSFGVSRKRKRDFDRAERKKMKLEHQKRMQEKIESKKLKFVGGPDNQTDWYQETKRITRSQKNKYL